MENWLGNAPEHQADAHADTEHHAHPRNCPEFRKFVIGPELDLAETADRQEPGKDQEQRGRDNKAPSETADNRRKRSLGDGSEAVWSHRSP